MRRILPRTLLARHQVLKLGFYWRFGWALYDAPVVDNKLRPMRSLLSHPDEWWASPASLKG